MKGLLLSFSYPLLPLISQKYSDLRHHQCYSCFSVHRFRKTSFRQCLLPPSSTSITPVNHHRIHLCKCSFRQCLLPPSSTSIISVNYRRIHRGDASAAASNEGKVEVMSYEELVQKDYSFLEMGNSPVVLTNIERIVSAGLIEETSKVLVSFGSEEFVDKLADPLKCQFLLMVHDSLFVLAFVKQKYDQVKCWQGEVIYSPEKWAPFDVVFLYFLPGLPFALDSIFKSLASRCLPGARVVVSHPLGRQGLEKQRQEFPECVVSNLPDKASLQKVTAKHAFEMTDFVDDPGFYLAVLKFSDGSNAA